jgi:pimeloyl-ACP methyl ester carboxylesterase
MSISHTSVGQGPRNVIVLHDWSQDRSIYEPVRPYLNQNDFTFAFADVRGYGASRGQTGAYSAAEVVGDVAALADSLGWSKFSLIGHSMTGMVAQRPMVDIPDRLISVVATTPVPASGLGLDDDTFSFFVSMASDDEAFKQGMHALTSARYAEGWVDFKLARNRAAVETEAMVAYAHMWAKSDFSSEVQGLTTPILVVFGEHDNELLTKPTLAPVFEGWYPNLRTHVCPSGHYPMQETPVEYAHVVQSYLKITADA